MPAVSHRYAKSENYLAGLWPSTLTGSCMGGIAPLKLGRSRGSAKGTALIADCL